RLTSVGCCNIENGVHAPAPLLPVGLFFFKLTATAEIYTLSLHDALPISQSVPPCRRRRSRWRCESDHVGGANPAALPVADVHDRSEEHTSELQSLRHLVCRLLLEKKNKRQTRMRLPINYAMTDKRTVT